MIEATPELLNLSKEVVGLSLIVIAAFSTAQRRAIFRRAEGKCENGVVVGDERCERTFWDGWMVHAHHVKPRHMGGRDDTSNGTLLCIEHHGLAHLELFEEFGKQEDLRAFETLAETDPHTFNYREDRVIEPVKPINLPHVRGHDKT